MSLFPRPILQLAELVLADASEKSLMIVTAESCTGGLVGGLLTELAGSSNFFERGFVTYSNHAKLEILGVSGAVIRTFGAVSPQCAHAMAEGALKNSHAQLAVAITGVAGPGAHGPKPEGYVCFATALKDAETLTREEHFGALGRSNVRLASVKVAMQMLLERLA